jgi:mRNA interferase HigB
MPRLPTAASAAPLVLSGSTRKVIREVGRITAWGREGPQAPGDPRRPDGEASTADRGVHSRFLREFRKLHADAEEPLLAWYREVEKEDRDTPAKVKTKYRTASIVGDNRAVFNIKGNDYRLVVKINYPYRVVYIRFVGTHAEYDGIDAEEV